MKERARERIQKPISQQGGQVANYEAEYSQSSCSGLQAECSAVSEISLQTSIHIALSRLFFPQQYCLKSSHPITALSCGTGSLPHTLSLSLCASAETVNQSMAVQLVSNLIHDAHPSHSHAKCTNLLHLYPDENAFKPLSLTILLQHEQLIRQQGTCSPFLYL